MATLADNNFPNLANIAKRLDPNGKIAEIAELLDKDNDILEDIPWVEANGPTGHRITDRTALPSMTAAWRTFNQGVPSVKSDTAQFDEVCGLLEAYAQVDVDLADLNGNKDAYRASESHAIIEALNQEFLRALFYESVLTNPEMIHGLSPRYAASSGYTSSSYVLPKGTRSGTNCHSIWLITWDPERMFAIFPKASKAGLQVMDRGIRQVVDSTGKMYEAYVEKFQWRVGLAVRDYRYAVRLQWDPDDTAFADSAKTLYLGMQEMLGTIKKVMPTTRFYADRITYNKLNAQLASNSANYLEYVAAGGKRIPSFLGVPIRLTDALVEESAIS